MLVHAYIHIRYPRNATSNNPGYEPEYQANTVQPGKNTLQLFKTTFRVWEGRERKEEGEGGREQTCNKEWKGRGKVEGKREGKEKRKGSEGEREKGAERQRRLIVNHSGVAVNNHWTGLGMDYRW